MTAIAPSYRSSIPGIVGRQILIAPQFAANCVLPIGPSGVVIVKGVSPKHAAGIVRDFAPHGGMAPKKSIEFVMALQIPAIVDEIRIAS